MIEESKYRKCCETCKHAHKRSAFDFKRNGNYGHPYECCMEDEPRYKRSNDYCDEWEKGEQHESTGFSKTIEEVGYDD